MKKIIAFMLILAGIFQSNNTSAQRKGFSAGLEGGPGVRTLYGDGVEDMNSTTGFAAGLTAQFSFSEFFALRTGLSYDLKGAMNKDIILTDNTGNEVGNADIKYNFKYLTLPVLFRATVSMDHFSVFGNVGVFGAYLLNEETQWETDIDLGDDSIDESESFNDFDMGSVLGLGAIYTINEMFNISAEVRNYLGFADINNYESGDNINTMSTMLLIGFSHNFGKKEDAKPKE